MKALIFGNGFIGKRLQNGLPDSVLYPGKIGEFSQISEIIQSINPSYVINAIGKSYGNNIDGCETHVDETFFANYEIPKILASVCAKNNLAMVNLGTGCIFSGTNDSQGFSEEVEPNFISNVYYRSKRACEEELSQYPNLIQLRIRLPIDTKPHKKNLVSKILTFDKIVKVPNSVTYLPDLFHVIPALVEKKLRGVFHVVSPGIETHDMILQAFQGSSIFPTNVEIESFERYAVRLKVPRSFCLLNTQKILGENISLTPIEMAVQACSKSFQNLQLNGQDIQI